MPPNPLTEDVRSTADEGDRAHKKKYACTKGDIHQFRRKGHQPMKPRLYFQNASFRIVRSWLIVSRIPPAARVIQALSPEGCAMQDLYREARNEVSLLPSVQQEK